MLSYSIEVVLDSYIADPYWPEQERLINIRKESGMDRAQSSANRRKSLEEYLRQAGMTLADFEELGKAAQRPFYTADGDGSPIVIPANKVAAMMVATCYQARAAFRPCNPEQVRSLMRFSGWTTNISPEHARVWERFAVVSSGRGAKLSNQRGLRRNWYVGGAPPDDTCLPTETVTASGRVLLRPEAVKPEVLRAALEYAGETVGIGASRKMGWGRFSIAGFEPA